MFKTKNLLSVQWLSVCIWELLLFAFSVGTEVTLLNYYLPASEVIFNGGTLEDDCNIPVGDTDLRICDVPSRLADNITKEGQEFDSNSFVRFRGDFELIFRFPDSHISLVDIYFYNNPGMGYGLPPVKAGFSFGSLVNFNAIQVSFADNSHLSQSDDSVTVVSIVVSSDPGEFPYPFLRLSFDNSSTQLSETYISEVKLFNGTGFTPKFTEIQFSRPNQTVEYGDNNDIVSSVEISCTVAVEGSFSITWAGPNGTITDSGDKIKIYSADTTRTSILRITQLSLMDNGTYSCEASYSHPMNFDVDSATNTITLILGGSVSHPNTVQAQVGDESVTLQCNFTGYLPSTINVIWRDNEGVEIEDANDEYNITTSLSGPGVSQRGGDSVESGVTSSLTITNIKNETEYTCIMEGTSIQGTIQLIERIVPSSSSSSSTLSISSSLSFTFSSSPSSVPTLPTSSSSNELLVVALSSSIVVGIVLLTVSVLTVILTMLVCYRKKRSNNISLKDLTMNQSYGVVADSACYVDIDAEIQKETEAMFSGSVIDKSRLDLIEKLGEGEFGVVYRGKLTGQSNNIPTAVAVKTLKGSVDPSKADSIINEALKMKSFNHLNVLPLIGICLDPIEAPCIVMPFMNEGSLLSYLRREKHNLIVSGMAEEKTISETTKKLLSMCLQVATGMAYLADKKFVHRDLAARNCMISSDGIIKVADFGLSEDIYESEYFKQPKESKEKVKLPLKWMAPESIHYRTFNEKTDVWSYGVVCWEVFTSGMSPYSNMSPKDVLDTLNAGQRLDKPSNAACSEEIYSLMLVCWNESASKRHCFHEIVNKLEHLIAPLSEYMDFTELYVTIRKEK